MIKLIKCNKCGAVFGKFINNCPYCGAEGSMEEVMFEDIVQALDNRTDDIVEEEKPKKKRTRKKKS